MDLVERGSYLAALGEHLAVAAAGHGRLVLVGGEAGIGKTALVRRFVDEHGAGARTLWGACDGLFTPQPLRPLLDMAGDLDLDVAAPQRELFTATLDALRPGLTIAVFEDVHWADGATVDLLRFLGRRLDQTSTLLVATYRDDELGPDHPLRVVLGDVEAARRIMLAPLSREGVRLLAQDSGLDATELHRRTGGNPFFVTEVLATGIDGVPESVRDAVLARTARLSPEAKDLLDAAAVIGLRAEAGVLGAIAAEGVEECLAAGVLQRDERGVAFRHELARQAVEEAIEPLRRAELHRRVLEALPRTDAARLAHHAEGAGDAQAALEFATRAGAEAAERGAHREAAAQYLRAVRFADRLPPAKRAELLARVGAECHHTDQIEDALAARRGARRLYRTLGDQLREGDMLREISLSAYQASEIDESSRNAQEAIDVLEQLPPGRELALAYSNMANQAQLGLDEQGTARWGERALALAEELGEDGIVISTLTTIGVMDAIAERGTEKLERSLALALDHGTDDQVGRVYGALVFEAVRHRRWAAAEHWLAEGLPYVTDRDLDHWRTYLLGWQAAMLLDRGRWDEAAEAAQAGLVNPHARLSKSWPLLALAQLRARRGDPASGALLEEALELVSEDIGQKRAPIAVVRAEAAFLAGDPDTALSETGLVPVAALFDRWVAGKLAVWRKRLGGSPENPGRLPEPFALELAGEHRAAAEAWEALECPYDAAMALSGSDDEADLRRSHELFLSLGAQPMAGIVARRLRERGARGVARGPRTATRENPYGLTGREQSVLELLTEGLTNAEIAAKLVVTEKTVGHHVSSILRKLGVRSRYDAAKLALEDREPASQT